MYLFDDLVASRAVELALPVIRGLVMLNGVAWGPKGVVVVLMGPSMAAPYVYRMSELQDEPQVWNKLTAQDFEVFARKKCLTAYRLHMRTEEVLMMDPAALEGTDTLYAGGDVLGSLACGVSGLNGWADAQVASVVLICAQTLCRLMVETMRAEKGRLVSDRLVEARQILQIDG